MSHNIRTMRKPQASLIHSHFSRRQFLGAATAATALFYITPRNALKAGQRISANDKLNVAGIGIGGQGGSDIAAVAAEGQNIVALCDVDSKYAAKNFAKYPNARQFKDYRVMLDKMGKEIDGVKIRERSEEHTS